MADRFNYIRTKIEDLIVCERKPIVHELGWFVRSFCAEEFKEIGFKKPVLQINQTLTRLKGSIRGLHFQYVPFAEAKFVTCVKGEVFDVAIDIREGSPTFLQWHAEKLSEDNNRGLYIPEGFAHGFQTLTDNCQMLYLHTASYQHSHEGALNAKDPVLKICWPFKATDMSDRDKSHPFIGPNFKGIKT